MLSPLGLLFLQFSVLMLAALAFGRIAKFLGQPAVIGEIAGGILIGPSLLGHCAPNLFAWLFPLQGEVVAARETILKLGMAFFLFAAGLEVRMDALRTHWKAVTATGILGSILPFGLGVAGVLTFPLFWKEDFCSETWTAFFIGTSLSISAIPVIARIFLDMNLMRTRLASITLGGAALSDLLGWVAFAVLLARHSNATISTIMIVGRVILFAVLFFAFGNSIAQPLLRLARRSLKNTAGYLGFVCALVLLAGALAELAGINAAFGTFLLGVSLAHGVKQDAETKVREIITQFSVSFFAPLYFVSVGLRLDFGASMDWLLVLALLTLAIFGKVLGAGLGARFAGIPWRESWAVGFALNARGAMMIVLASVALDAGLIGARLFVALVSMALITSILAGPALKWLVHNEYA